MKIQIFAIYIPHLSMQRALHRVSLLGSGGSNERVPFAIVDEGQVLCSNRAASQAGVHCGDTVAQARAACPSLKLNSRDAAGDRAALCGLAEAMLSLSPVVEISPPDTLLLDASSAALWGGFESWGQKILTLVKQFGYRSHAVMAPGRLIARALARYGNEAFPREAKTIEQFTGIETFRMVSAASLAAALAPLPIKALEAAVELSQDMAERLARLGIHDIGALARLPVASLVHRFGPAGAVAARLARGEDHTQLLPYIPEALPQESCHLESPIESSEQLLFILKSLSDRLSSRLSGQRLGATRFKLVLKLDQHLEEEWSWSLACPTATSKQWLTILRERTASLRLAAPVTGIRLEIAEAAPMPVTQLSFQDRGQELAAFENVMLRLSARLGSNLFSAYLTESYRPESAYQTLPCSPQRRSVAIALHRADAPRPGLKKRPSRLLSHPKRVNCEGQENPTALWIDGQFYLLLKLEGPERLEGEWWSESFARDYYRAELQNLGECWLYRDSRDQQFYLHGFFD